MGSPGYDDVHRTISVTVGMLPGTAPATASWWFGAPSATSQGRRRHRGHRSRSDLRKNHLERRTVALLHEGVIQQAVFELRQTRRFCRARYRQTPQSLREWRRPAPGHFLRATVTRRSLGFPALLVDLSIQVQFCYLDPFPRARPKQK